MKKCLVVMSILALVAVLAVGCTGATLPMPTPSATPIPTLPAGMGTLEVRVTDAPPGYEIISIMVTVSEEDGEGVKARRAVDDGEDEWETIDIIEDNNPFDLTLLEDGLQTILAMAEVLAGKYTQIRMNIETVEVTYTYLEGGETQENTVEAILPSGELKFVRPFDVVEGETTTLLLDFIADKSVAITGATKDEQVKVIFKPVVKLSIQQGGKPHQLTSIDGTISEVDTEALTVSIIPDVGDEIVLNVNPQTEITLDDEATLEELDVGQSVTAYYYLNNLKATQIIAESPP